MYRVVQSSEMYPETRAMVDLSSYLRNYFSTLYQMEIIDKWRMYVIPEGEPLEQFVNDLIDFINGEIIDIEGQKWIINSSNGVHLTVGLPGKLDTWCPSDCYMVEISHFN